VWAATYLLSLLDNQGKAPEDWVNKVSNSLIQKLSAMGRKDNIIETAVLTCALSICHKRITANKIIADVQNIIDSPFVKTPLTQQDSILAALKFLKANQKDGMFGFSGYPDPGITALTLSAVIRASRQAGIKTPEYVDKGLAYLQSLQKKDGSIYQHGLANYVTSASIMAFKDSGMSKFDPTVDAAKDFLITLQCDEGEGYSVEADPNYGGLGYGGDERPDLSNTQMAVEALKSSGLNKDHEAFKKAIRFLQRCQNLSEVNPTRVQITPKEKIISGNDGGGIYYPGNSKADLEEVNPGVFVARSYGSMTYALLKSYILAGMEKSDKRILAAVNWISKNYTLEENPGFKNIPGKEVSQQGLYYYYLTMARALNALDIDSIDKPGDKSHRWREELRNKLLSIQRVDGSWLNNRAPRWFEGNPVLATAYALLVLDECAK